MMFVIVQCDKGSENPSVVPHIWYNEHNAIQELNSKRRTFPAVQMKIARLELTDLGED